ncbi:hypothetical protein UNDKW_3197 [Undibacterium sp. KW1]|nr:hypothetical protein UNDKW_3197 [Undibacterium sp. KW1]
MQAEKYNTAEPVLTAINERFFTYSTFMKIKRQIVLKIFLNRATVHSSKKVLLNVLLNALPNTAHEKIKSPC